MQGPAACGSPRPAASRSFSLTMVKSTRPGWSRCRASTFSIWLAGADQRPDMLDRLDLLELHEAGAGDAVDRLAGRIGDEMKVESAGPCSVSAMGSLIPVMIGGEKPAIRQRGCRDSIPVPRIFLRRLHRAGYDLRTLRRIPGISHAAASIHPRTYPRFSCGRLPRRFCRLIRQTRSSGCRRPRGLYLQGDIPRVTSTNPRIQPTPILPLYLIFKYL